MEALLRALVLGLAVLAIGAVGEARAQTPAPAPTPAPIEGNVYTVIYVEVMPTSKSDATVVLRRYRDAARKEGGNLRCEIAQRIDQPHQFVILSIWKDQKSWEAHGKGAASMEMREKVAALKRLGDESRKGDGNLRFEVVQQVNRQNHFTVVEIWKDPKAVEAHSMAAATREFRDKLASMTGALYDERTYK